MPGEPPASLHLVVEELNHRLPGWVSVFKQAQISSSATFSLIMHLYKILYYMLRHWNNENLRLETFFKAFRTEKVGSVTGW